MFDKSQAIFTYTLTAGILVINVADGITAVAMKLTSGTGTFKGTKRIGTVDSTATSLVANDPVTVSAEQTKYLDQFTIDASAGVIEIIAR